MWLLQFYKCAWKESCQQDQGKQQPTFAVLSHLSSNELRFPGCGNRWIKSFSPCNFRRQLLNLITSVTPKAKSRKTVLGVWVYMAVGLCKYRGQGCIQVYQGDLLKGFFIWGMLRSFGFRLKIFSPQGPDTELHDLGAGRYPFPSPGQ